MVKPIELKEEAIILHEGKSYFILEVFPWNVETENGINPEQLNAEVVPVSCKYCGGNLFKRGTKKGQYLCSDCNRPNWLNSEGEHEEA